MNASFFQPKELLRDFLRELRIRGSPRFPARGWLVALQIAEAADIRRWVKQQNDVLWPDPRPITLCYLEDDDPHKLIFLGWTVGTAQPANEIAEAQHLSDQRSDRRYRERHQQQIADYNKRYRRKNREAFLAWQRDYRHAHADRLNAIRRAKRAQAAGRSAGTSL